MEVNKGLLAFFAEEEVAVGVVIHEEVFGEDGGAGGVAEEVEVGFLVGVGVGVVGAEAVAGEVGLGGGVEGGGEGIGPGVATGGVGAPAAGGEPAVASAGGIAVDGDEEDVVFAQLAASLSLPSRSPDQERKKFPAFFSGGRFFLCPDGRMAWKFRGKFSDVVNFWPPRNGLPGRFEYSGGQ